jgi:predicted RNase H-like HicB family nuclease
MKSKLTRVIQKRGDWYIAYVKEVPGVNPQGRTFAEAQRNLDDALRMVKSSRHPIAYVQENPDCQSR